MRHKPNYLDYGAVLAHLERVNGSITFASLGGRIPFSMTGYVVNGDIGLLIKTDTDAKGCHGKFSFSFSKPCRVWLQEAAKWPPWRGLVVALYCPAAKVVCYLTYAEVRELLWRRRAAKGIWEKQIFIHVSVPKRAKLQVSVNEPGRPGHSLGEPTLVKRNRPLAEMCGVTESKPKSRGRVGSFVTMRPSEMPGHFGGQQRRVPDGVLPSRRVTGPTKPVPLTCSEPRPIKLRLRRRRTR